MRKCGHATYSIHLRVRLLRVGGNQFLHRTSTSSEYTCNKRRCDVRDGCKNDVTPVLPSAVALEVAFLALVLTVVAVVGFVTSVLTVAVAIAAPHVRNAVLLLNTLELVRTARRLR